MQESIRKFDEAAKEWLEAVERLGIHLCRVPHPCRALVPEARVGYHKSQPCPFLWLFRSPLPPRENVAKSVAKARKSHQVTTSQPQPHQRHRMDLPLKEPHPPFSTKTRHLAHPGRSPALPIQQGRQLENSRSSSPAIPRRSALQQGTPLLRRPHSESDTVALSVNSFGDQGNTVARKTSTARQNLGQPTPKSRTSTWDRMR